jgi:ABC-type sulfate/molybdate transport systems ATPase subunit
MWHAKTTRRSITSYDAESRGQLNLRIRRRFQGFQLDVQAHIPLGFTALFGVSGAGKSLTLRSLVGLLHPDVGEIVLDGRILFDSQGHIFLPPQARRIGYVPQHSALFPHQTVVEQIRFALPTQKRNSTARIPQKVLDARIAELVAALELEGLEHHYPNTLSGGQQRRVALARALAADPHLLVLDEPFSALDVPVRERLYELLRHLHKQYALPVILVTHDRAEVEQLADTVVVMQEGRIVQIGNVQEVFQAPRTPDIAGLVGQGNLFGGKLATPSSTQEGAPATAIRLEWFHYAKAGEKFFAPMHEEVSAWLPLLSPQIVQASRQINGCIHADEIIVSRYPEQGSPPSWTPEGAVQWQATLLRVQRLGPSLRLHFHPHWAPTPGIIEVYVNHQQWREIVGTVGEVFLLKIAPTALHCFP